MGRTGPDFRLVLRRGQRASISYLLIVIIVRRHLEQIRAPLGVSLAPG